MIVRPARFFVLALLATFTAVSPAAANSFADVASKVDALVKTGKLDEAYEMLRAETANLASTMPFAIKRAMFVAEKPIAYGSYKGAASNTFPVGSTLITYTEPVGLKWTRDADGAMTTRFTVDFELRNPAGELLAGQKAFGNFVLSSREALQEIYTPLTLDVSQVPKGDYVIRYIFTDVNAKATASVDQPFTLK